MEIMENPNHRLFVVQVVMCFFVRWKIYYFVRLLNLRERNKNGRAFKKR